MKARIIIFARLGALQGPSILYYLKKKKKSKKGVPNLSWFIQGGCTNGTVIAGNEYPCYEQYMLYNAKDVLHNIILAFSAPAEAA